MKSGYIVIERQGGFGAGGKGASGQGARGQGYNEWKNQEVAQ